MHVRCVLKGPNKGRKSFHAPSASHQLAGAPSWGLRDSPPLPPSLFQINEMNGDLRALFYPEGCVYTCHESQWEAGSWSQNAALSWMGLGQSLGFSVPSIPHSRPLQGAGCLPPFLRLSIHQVILELLEFLARLVVLNVF